LKLGLIEEADGWPVLIQTKRERNREADQTGQKKSECGLCGPFPQRLERPIHGNQNPVCRHDNKGPKQRDREDSQKRGIFKTALCEKKHAKK
jgi:hypothetical protein